MKKNTKRSIQSIVIIYILLFSVICLSGCEKDKVPLSGEPVDISGTWGNQKINDSILTFSRSGGLAEGEYGIVFKRNGQFIERKNSGWCGTPPVIYEDFTGDWSVSDSIILIHVPYWGGTADYEWKIISLSKNKLEIAVISTEFHYAP